MKHNQYHVGIDVRKAKGAYLLRRLVAKSDILVENFRPGTMLVGQGILQNVCKSNLWGTDPAVASVENDRNSTSVQVALSPCRGRQRIGLSEVS